MANGKVRKRMKKGEPEGDSSQLKDEKPKIII